MCVIQCVGGSEVDLHDLSSLSCCSVSHVVAVTSTAYMVSHSRIHTSSTTANVRQSYLTAELAYMQNKQMNLCILSFPKSTVTGESIFSASVCWNDLPSVTAQTLFFTFSTTLSQASHSHTTCSALSSITNTSFSSTCNNVHNKCILSVSLSH